MYVDYIPEDPRLSGRDDDQAMGAYWQAIAKVASAIPYEKLINLFKKRKTPPPPAPVTWAGMKPATVIVGGIGFTVVAGILTVVALKKKKKKK